MKNSCTLLFLLFALTTFAQPGALDITFSGDGKVTTNYGGIDQSGIYTYLNQMAQAVAIQSDGKILAAGYTGVFYTAAGIGTSVDDAIMIVRYNSNGTLDNSFGTNGIVTTAVSPYNIYAKSIAVQSDGKILVAGYTAQSTFEDFVLIRYNSNGTLDYSFNGNGKIISPLVSRNFGNEVCVQSDGKIIISGLVQNGSYNYDFFVFRYDNNGELDDTFSDDGKVITNVGNLDNDGSSACIQLDGKIVLLGATSSNTHNGVLVRYNIDGSLDNSFDFDGKVNVDIVNSGYFNSVALQDDGKIVVGGNTIGTSPYDKMVLLRYNLDGSLDLNFSNDGMVFTDFGINSYCNDIDVQANGKIVIAGGVTNASSNLDFALARFNMDGTIDESFSSDGKLSTVISSGNVEETAYAVAIQTDGRIVAVGYTAGSSTNYNENFALVRYIGDAVEYPHYLKGHVYDDISNDCNKQTLEQGLPFPVVTSNGDSYAYPNDSGYYSLGLKNSINYTIEPVIPRRFAPWVENPCPANYSVYKNESDPLNSFGFDFGFDYAPCFQLRTDVSAVRKRRCFRNYSRVFYTNEGLIAANGVEVHVKFDSFDIPLSASAAYTWDVTNNSLVFNIGTLNAGQSGYITIVDSVACINGITGLTQCTKAWISPPNTCLIDSTTGSAWDHSSIEVNGQCANDTVRFVILNNGSGDMTNLSEFRIYADNVISHTGTFQLISGDSLVLKVVSVGATIRMEANQHPDHPGNSLPRSTVEACGTSTSGTFSLGQVNQAPMDDEDVNIEIDCIEIIDSFDPNEKLVSPKGASIGHIVLPNTPLDFIIHFQNTGTDTAYKIVVVDTLSQYFDLSTLELGTSSHSYKTALSGIGKPIITFTFNNINLVDSTTNELLSHGFVKFKITPKSSTPLGTQINNLANIYFDYNLPIQTNTAFVKLGNYSMPTNSIISKIACISYTAPDGVIYTTSGTKTAIIQNAAGYDSTITVHLSIKNNSFATINPVVCKSYTAPNGAIYTTSGPKTVIIPNAFGCDSIITINLTIKDTYKTIIASACASYTAPDGAIHTTSGTKKAIIPNAIGCDSIITIILKIKNSYKTISASACLSYTAPDGAIYTTSGTKTAIIPNVAGCDSTITINLTINDLPDVSVNQNDIELYATLVGANYQWIDCSNGNATILSQTAQNYTATDNGDYAVIVTQNSCSDTSSCYTISTIGLSENKNNNSIQIYPNPSNGLVTIVSDNSFLNTTIKFTTIEGALVYEKQNVNVSSLSIDLSSVANGIYFIQIIEQNAISNYKLIKN